jgi:hypothetical protein
MTTDQEDALFTTIRTYRIDPDQLDAAMHKADVEFADQVAALDGFVAYELVQTAPNRIASITTCRDKDTTRRTNEMAAEWVAAELADVDIERIGTFGGDVLVSRASQDALVPAHH